MCTTENIAFDPDYRLAYIFHHHRRCPKWLCDTRNSAVCRSDPVLFSLAHNFHSDMASSHQKHDAQDRRHLAVDSNMKMGRNDSVRESGGVECSSLFEDWLIPFNEEVEQRLKLDTTKGPRGSEGQAKPFDDELGASDLIRCAHSISRIHSGNWKMKKIGDNVCNEFMCVRKSITYSCRDLDS